MTLAPVGIIATASSTETALMMKLRSANDQRKGESDGDVGEGHRRSFDLHQGFPLLRVGGGNVDAFQRFGP
jgi:hypothetical protein